MVDQERRIAFDIYFASVVGMNLHPGTTRDKAERRSIEECRAMAEDMLAQRDAVFPPESSR
jgi:hypothetical protein